MLEVQFLSFPRVSGSRLFVSDAKVHVLAGLLLFFFSGGFDSESWEAIEPFRSPPGGESFPRAIAVDGDGA